MLKSLIFNLVVVLLVVHRTSAQCEPAPTVNCIIYNDIQLKTFDGNIYGFISQCSYTLLSMSSKGLTVNYLRNPSGLQIVYGGRMFSISVSGGVGSLTRDGISQTIPSTLNGIKFSQPGRLFIANIVGLAMKIKYDGDTTEIILNNDATTPATRGLCSDNNGCTNDDLLLPNGQLTTSITDWANSWATSSCISTLFQSTCDLNDLSDAENFCTNLLNSAKFGNCNIISGAFMEICTSDYCTCTTLLSDPMECVCSLLDMYVRTCEVGLGILMSWRDAQTCPIICTPSSETYLRCAYNNKQLKCGEDEITDPSLYDCEEGCYCPNGLRRHNGQCIAAANCPCSNNNVEYPSGTVMDIECNECSCNSGKWTCTNDDCITWGECIGDPHCITFDGLYFDFQGQCMYYLVRGPGFDVICDHWAWNSVGYVKNILATSPSVCARVLIEFGGNVIVLDQGKVVTVNGNTVTPPSYKPTYTISNPSSEFVTVTLWNDVQIAFNGQYHVRVGVPYNMHGDVSGILGTFTGTTTDDFTKPDNTIAPNANEFGHSWKVPGSCEGDYPGPVPHPCTVNPSRESIAISSCSPIQGTLFTGCSDNPTVDYDNCVYDICECTDDDPKCLCQHFATQGMKCAQKGIFVDWRATITQCAITCSNGQTFQLCGNSCQRTCDDISLYTNCVQRCYEGCNCPPGQSMNYLDQCVPISQCTCIYNGARFKAGDMFVDTDALLQYTCENGRWTIVDPPPPICENCPPIQCNAEAFEVYAGCKRTNTITCYNKHLEERGNFDNCVAGCECIDGYVFDSELGSCVLPENCPCMYKGISYPDDSVINNREEECLCVLGAWVCEPVTNHLETCMVYGDIHVRSFDDTIFSFEGYCEYVVFSYQSPQFGSIRAVIETSSCSTGTCIQTAYIHRKALSGPVENVIFNADGSYITSTTLNNLIVTDMGATIVVDVVGAGLRFVWNRSGVLEVHAGPNWLTQTSTGLCGKYDNNPNNDIQVNGQNVAITAFVDKYKLDKNCAGSTPIPDIDMLLPEDPCNYLTSQVFKTCNLLVDVQRYLKTCFKNAQQQKEIPPEQRRNHYCSVFTAYAQQCTNARSPVNWRTSTICPLQCNGNQVLHQCETPCPRENCSNTSGYSCTDTVCVEACKSPSCPTGQIYLDATNTQCVAPNQCPATRRFARWG